MFEDRGERRRIVRFELGEVGVTPAALMALIGAGMTPQDLLDRHQAGDFGDMGAEDREVNRKAVRLGGRVLSQYDLPTGERIWVISDPGARTTVLLARGAP